MKVSLIKPSELSEDLLSAWSDIQQSDRSFDNPYFRPEFTLAVAQVRNDVEVAVLEDAGAIAGFFPFQRFARRVGKPVGGRLSDFQAVIVRPESHFDPRQLVRECGLVAWDFDHLLLSQQQFAPYRYTTEGSPYVDLSDGYEAYCRRRRAMGSNELKDGQRKARKMDREVGPLRVELHSPSQEMFQLLLEWKSDQYQRTKITDVFSFEWTRQLLAHLLTYRDDTFAGVLTVLYAGDRPAAMHLGMWSHGVLHYWFPTYDTTLAAYSPGRILLLELARTSAEIGLRRIDLGKGMSTYKTRIMTDVEMVAMGSVDLRPLTNMLRTTWRQTQDWIRKSPLRAPARIPGRVLYRVREWLEFR
jgi:CelD/BcsL family acetyltransferase involved in cellulose biosynthesis